MKKIILVIVMSLLLIPNIYADSSIEIKSIELDSMSDTTTEISSPKPNGLEMSYDLRFKNVNDFAKYKIVIKNNTNNEYKVSEDTAFKISDYVTYKYESNKVIKPRSEETIYVVITYSKEVDPSLYNNGVYNDTNKAVLKLIDENGNLVNPKTGNINVALILSLVAVISTLSLLFLMNKKSSFFMLLFFISFIPLLVSAIEKLDLTINVKVQISNKPVHQVSYKILDFITKTPIEGCNIVYFDSVSEENKYYSCENKIIVDVKNYEEGDKVVVKRIKNNTYDSITSAQLNDPSVIEELSDGSKLLHDRNFREYEIEKWDYNCSETASEDVCLISDKEVMNFSSIVVDRWDEQSKSITVKDASTFTMPGHNVLFEESLVGSTR